MLTWTLSRYEVAVVASEVVVEYEVVLEVVVVGVALAAWARLNLGLSHSSATLRAWTWFFQMISATGSERIRQRAA